MTAPFTAVNLREAAAPPLHRCVPQAEISDVVRSGRLADPTPRCVIAAAAVAIPVRIGSLMS
ncbi:hypothetical protein [Bradyrhizobium sp. SK17]|uniref:hypothetical protein n=1 Tax=Bradyrhizobium sp. SK17 TaxID=2057741 RepID=UPI0012FE5360|nr:hypothetical protein [Bradyrhizobium sp. SK17]